MSSISSGNPDSAFDRLPSTVGQVLYGEPFILGINELSHFEKATWLDQAYPADPEEFPEDLIEGFLLLAMLDPILRFAEAAQAADQPPEEPSMWGLNYGLDSVRFVSQVHVGDRILSSFQTKAVEPKDAGFKVLRHCVFTVDGHPRPAMTADWWSFVLPRGTLEKRRRT
jgi:acyl dehydratase